MKQKGFTLIELLVVISIISLLSTISVTSFNAVKKRANDTKRVAGLVNIRKAIEQYKIENNDQLPPTNGWNNFSNAILDSFPNGVPTNFGSSMYYFYCTTPTKPNYYVLVAYLEGVPADPGTVTSVTGTYSCALAPHSSYLNSPWSGNPQCNPASKRFCLDG